MSKVDSNQWRSRPENVESSRARSDAQNRARARLVREHMERYRELYHEELRLRGLEPGVGGRFRALWKDGTDG